MSRRREARDLERVLALSMRENESRNAVVEVTNQSVSPTSIAVGPVQETTGAFSPVPEHHARGNETMLLNHVVHTDPSQGSESASNKVGEDNQTDDEYIQRDQHEADDAGKHVMEESRGTQNVHASHPIDRTARSQARTAKKGPSDADATKADHTMNVSATSMQSTQNDIEDQRASTDNEGRDNTSNVRKKEWKPAMYSDSAATAPPPTHSSYSRTKQEARTRFFGKRTFRYHGRPFVLTQQSPSSCPVQTHLAACQGLLGMCVCLHCILTGAHRRLKSRVFPLKKLRAQSVAQKMMKMRTKPRLRQTLITKMRAFCNIGSF